MKITSITIANTKNRNKYMLFQGKEEFQSLMHQSRKEAAAIWGCPFDETEIAAYTSEDYPNWGRLSFLLGVFVASGIAMFLV